MPWYIDDVEDKIQTALGMNHLTAIEIGCLDCKSWVANEFLDVLCSYDMPEYGIDKLTLLLFKKTCEPIEEEVVSRLANISTRLSHLQLQSMHNLSEAGRMSLAGLFRQIVQNNPPI